MNNADVYTKTQIDGQMANKVNVGSVVKIPASGIALSGISTSGGDYYYLNQNNEVVLCATFSKSTPFSEGELIATLPIGLRPAVPSFISVATLNTSNKILAGSAVLQIWHVDGRINIFHLPVGAAAVSLCIQFST